MLAAIHRAATSTHGITTRATVRRRRCEIWPAARAAAEQPEHALHWQGPVLQSCWCGNFLPPAIPAMLIMMAQANDGHCLQQQASVHAR